jgi:SAM-dependent methyltransferase
MSYIDFARDPQRDPTFWHYNLPEFLKLVPAPGALTMDVGCGEGRVARALAACGHTVVGVEPIPALAFAAQAHPAPTRTVIADGVALPIKARSADLVVFFMVLYNARELAGLLDEAARVLRPGSQLCAALIHPIHNIGRFSDDATEYTVRRSYFEQGERRAWSYWSDKNGSRIPIRFWHRPLSAYTEALSNAGFIIERLVEPMPPSEDSLVLLPRWQQRLLIPSFVHIRARLL